MLRQLQALCRAPSRSLTSCLLSSFIRSTRPQHHLLQERHFFSQSRIPCNGPRSNHYWRSDSRPRHLLASSGLHSTIYLSIAAIVFWLDDVDWRERRSVGIQTVQRVTGEQDPEEKRLKFFNTGRAIMEEFADGADIWEYKFELEDDPPICDCKIYSFPDPDVKGGTFFLYLVALNSETGETHILESGNRVTDIATSLIPELEELAEHNDDTSRARGALILLEDDGSWKSIYWDGKRWINIVFLEWQTPETMAYNWEY